MVMHHANPNTHDEIASSQPKTNIQIMFNKKLPMLSEKITSLPKGQNTNEANLKHCIPAGIAMIVQQQIMPATTHKAERISPPKINHNILLKVLILLLQSNFVVGYIVSAQC